MHRRIAAAHDGQDQDIGKIVVIGRWTDLAGSASSVSAGIVGQEEFDSQPSATEA
jgi:hypothetical protein